MAIITNVNLSVANDGQGDPLRFGGGVINTNFANLNNDKLEKGGYTGTAQDLNNAISNISTAGFVDISSAQTITGLKTIVSSTIVSLEVPNSLIVSGNLFVNTSGKSGITTNVILGGFDLEFIKGILTNVTAV